MPKEYYRDPQREPEDCGEGTSGGEVIHGEDAHPLPWYTAPNTPPAWVNPNQELDLPKEPMSEEAKNQLATGAKRRAESGTP
jgi:hypothetical protein